MVGLLVLLLLDPGQHLAETLVLDDGRVADALQLVEDGVGQGQSLPADFQPAIGKVINVNKFACAANLLQAHFQKQARLTMTLRKKIERATVTAG
jgi:hypothetical protein